MDVLTLVRLGRNFEPSLINQSLQSCIRPFRCANRDVFDGKKSVNVAQYWLRHQKRRQYEGLVFAPGQETPGYYNLWRGFAVEPKHGNCSLYLNHIRDVIASGDDEI